MVWAVVDGGLQSSKAVAGWRVAGSGRDVDGGEFGEEVSSSTSAAHENTERAPGIP
jgi:hypothetical protein